MKILAFDTTNSKLSICLNENKKTLQSTEISENSSQAETLICEIEKILQSENIWYENLDLIAATKGPGSFTGVRIGLSCAKALQLATKLPLLTFDSLLVLANKYKNFSTKIFVIIDARMDEFFIAEFTVENNKIATVSQSRLANLDELENLNLDENYFIVGSGKKTIAEIFTKKNIMLKFEKKEDAIDATQIAAMAYEDYLDGVKIDDSNPLYLRNPRITQRKK